MPLEVLTERITLNSRGAGENMQVLTEGDMIVPDVNPDIYQMFKNDEEVIIDRVKAEKGRINFSGRIVSSVLYYGRKTDRPISFMKTEFPIEDYISADGVTEETDADIMAEMIHSEYRMINDRKVNARFVCGIKASWTNSMDVNAVVSVKGENALQTKNATLSTGTVRERMTEEFVIRDELKLPPGKASIAEIIDADVKICNREMRMTGSGAQLKGDFKIWVMYIGDEENYPVESMEFTLPFNGNIEMQGVSDNAVSMARMMPVSLKTDVAADSNGEARVIDTEITVGTNVKVFEETKTEVLEDAYSLASPVEIDIFDTRCVELIGKNRAQGMFRGTVQTVNGQPAIMQIIKVWGNGGKARVTAGENAVTAEGTANVKVMYIAKDDNMPINIIESAIPYSQEIEINGVTPSSIVDALVETEDINFSLVSENEVDVRLTMSFDVAACTNKACTIITDIRESEDTKDIPLKGGAVIYTVKKGDMLWNIAKKYHTTVADIYELNKDKIEDPDLIYPGQRFLIIKKFV